MKKAHKLSLSVLTAAMVMATGVANAAVVLPTTGDGELFMTAWDSVRNVSYSRQLDINIGSFTGTTNLSFTGDALFASTFAGSAASNVQWNLVGGDYSLPVGGSPNTNGNYRLMTTSTNLLPTGFSLTNGGLSTALNAVNNFATALNTMGCDVNASCATSDPASFGFGGSPNFGTNLGLVGGISSAGTGFGSLNFWNITGGGGNIATQTSRIRFNEVGLTTPALVTLAADGGISYVSAVPLPAAVWLFGSGLLGLVGIARRRSQPAARA